MFTKNESLKVTKVSNGFIVEKEHRSMEANSSDNIMVFEKFETMSAWLNLHFEAKNGD